MIKRFSTDKRGFVLVLSLLALPVFIGFALIIIDIGRGNNIHADLSAAADAVALAGAGELDGGADAIIRAKTAMSALTNTVSMIGKSGDDMEIKLVYEDVSGNEFSVVFLEDIPDDDTTPIDFSKSTTDPTKAKFIWVKAQSKDLITAFLNPITGRSESISISAVAVAQAKSAACDIPPLFICNPFENDSVGLQTRFNNGDLHGRIIRLHPKGNVTAAPGNFGFLAVTGVNGDTANGKDKLRDFFAGDRVPACYDTAKVTTEPGAAEAVAAGINVRFDMYKSPYGTSGGGANAFDTPPALNVRKGFIPHVNGSGAIDECVGQGANGGEFSPYHIQVADASNNYAFPAVPAGSDILAYGLPDNDTMSHPGDLVAGAAIGTGDWPIETYLSVNYALSSTEIDDLLDPDETDSIPNSFAGSTSTLGAQMPSRYDVYRWEIEQWADALPPVDYLEDRSIGEGTAVSRKGEMGFPACGYDPASSTDADYLEGLKDRRVMPAAIIDCDSLQAEMNGKKEVPVNSYASIFLARPMDETIDIEIIDITGYGGNGTLDTYIRKEAVLVR